MAEAVQAGSRALAVLERVRGQFAAMAPRRRNGLITAAVMALTLIAGIAWYAGRPDWRVLFSGLDGKDVAQVAQELGAAGIPFQMTADGTGVEVPAESLDKARMEVAAKGMPQTGRLGFELFDKPNWVGSEFDERVNYQRAMEGELEHTIATLGVVRSARVHLVLPQASLFTSEEKVAKASVVLKLKKASLGPEETESIRNLVAGAVENLNPDQVTLVDADGRLNLQARGHGALAGDEEREMETKLVAMLEPLAGVGNVRATVNVAYEQGSEERTDEVYDPAQTAVLTSQKSEQTSAGSRVAQGVPGTASNTPAAATTGAVQGSTKAAAPGTPPLLQTASKDALPVFPQAGNGMGQTTKEESGTYAVTRHFSHTEQGPGRVRRLTAAVVVNDRMLMEGAGKTAHEVFRPRTTDEMHRLEQLAQAAVGFDEKRGDQVVMENVGFSSNVAEVPLAGSEKLMEEAKSLLHPQPAVMKTAVMGLLGLLVVIFVLRPMAGEIVATMKEPVLLTGGTASDAMALRTGALARGELDSGSRTEWPSQQEVPRETPGIHEQVSDHIRREPQHSTRLLQAWIMADGEED